jgi:hypothetical protein
MYRTQAGISVAGASALARTCQLVLAIAIPSFFIRRDTGWPGQSMSDRMKGLT